MAMDFLAQHAARQPDRAAVILHDGPTLTYADLDRQANQLANAMLGLGLTSGDKCTTVGYNSTHHSIVGAAGRRLILVSLPMNYRLTPDEIEYQLNHSRHQDPLLRAGAGREDRVGGGALPQRAAQGGVGHGRRARRAGSASTT